jgi:hypothetical protein
MPKPAVLATVMTGADGQFRAELTDIRGYLDVELSAQKCGWTGAAKSINEEAIGESDSIRIDLTTRESVLCSDNQ